MSELFTSGSVGGMGRQLPVSTRRPAVHEPCRPEGFGAAVAQATDVTKGKVRSERREAARSRAVHCMLADVAWGAPLSALEIRAVIQRAP